MTTEHHTEEALFVITEKRDSFQIKITGKVVSYSIHRVTREQLRSLRDQADRLLKR